MNQPSDTSIRIATVVKLLESAGALAVFAAVLDAIGGGPQIMSTQVVLGAATLFIVARMALSIITGYWLVTYIDSVDSYDGMSTVISIAATIVVIGLASAIWFTYAMANTFTSIALITTFGVLTTIHLTDYGFEINGNTIISG